MRRRVGRRTRTNLLVPFGADSLQNLPNPIRLLLEVVVHERLEHLEDDILHPLLRDQRALRLDLQHRIDEAIHLPKRRRRRKKKERVLQRLSGTEEGGDVVRDDIVGDPLSEVDEDVRFEGEDTRDETAFALDDA